MISSPSIHTSHLHFYVSWIPQMSTDEPCHLAFGILWSLFPHRKMALSWTCFGQYVAKVSCNLQSFILRDLQLPLLPLWMFLFEDSYHAVWKLKQPYEEFYMEVNWDPTNSLNWVLAYSQQQLPAIEVRPFWTFTLSRYINSYHIRQKNHPANSQSCEK